MARIDRYTCQETFDRLNDYLDRELTPEEMRRVVEHLDVCALCTLEFQFEARLLQEIRARLRRIAAPEGLMNRIRMRIARADDEPESG